jgi:acyl transferase domain-containing protein
MSPVMPPVAIVGMGTLLPGADSLDGYWHNLVNGVDSITEVPPSRWDPEFFDPRQAAERADRVYCHRGGFVGELAEFEPLEYGIMPASVGDIEADQLIALRVAAAAVDDAGGLDRLPDRERIGVVIGRGGYLAPAAARHMNRVNMANQLVVTLSELFPELDEGLLDEIRRRFAARFGRDQPDGAIGLMPNLTASRIANRLDLRGPVYTVDAACASSLIAVDQAVTDLTSGRCDAVVAGGVHHCHDIAFWSVFSQIGALSRRGQIRPFDEGADGLLPGEGTGMVVLKRLADAQRDGDRVYAVIRGIGVASDGRSASLVNPEPSGQVMAMRRAWLAAGLDPTGAGSLGLLEAHGTATPVGDTAEMRSVTEFFGPRDREPPAVIGSVKSMIGHTMPAAGVAGLIKAALAVHEGFLLPTLHCEAPRRELQATRFAPLSAARPWEGTGPRRAAVNAFGFGGINSHVIIEQAPQTSGNGTRPGSRVRAVTPRAAGVAVTEPETVLQLAAPDYGALVRMLEADDALAQYGTGRDRGEDKGALCRLAVVDPTADRLSLARRVVARGAAWRGHRDIWFSPDPLLTVGPGAGIALVCPGIEGHLDPQVDDIAAHLGMPRRDWACQTLTQECVNLTELGRLLHKALTCLGVRASAVVGYSLGEWTAAAVAGLFDEARVEATLATADLEGCIMPGTALAVIGTDATVVARTLENYPTVLITHDNAPTQCIVSGPEADVQQLAGQFRQDGIVCHVRPLGAPFHMPLFASVLGDLRVALGRTDISRPSLAVWSAMTGGILPADPARARELLGRQLAEPVLFRQTVEAMYAAGFRIFLQLGTSQLTSVIGDNLRDRPHLSMAVNVPFRNGIDQLRRVAAALWAEGYPVSAADLDSWQPAVSPAVGRPRAAVKLDLSGALGRLGEQAPELARRVSSAVRSAKQADAGSGSSAVEELQRLPARPAVAADLGAFLEETATNALAVMKTTRAQALRSASPVLRGDGLQPAWRQRLEVSLTAMPYLRDHSLVYQPDYWPNSADRFPVMPGTTMLHHMMAAASGAGRDRPVVDVRNVRFLRWVPASPAQDVMITATTAGQDQFSVDFGGCASAQATVARTYPAARPAPWTRDPSTERIPEIRASQIYSDRWLFHGPKFQGITELLAIGDQHARAILTTPDTPGGLLDNAAQLIGYWIIASRSERVVIFPVGVRRLQFFGPEPPPGAKLECIIRIQSLTDDHLVADAQLLQDGLVWAHIEGWTEKRFHSDARLKKALHLPERNAASFQQPEGWAVTFDLWRQDLPTRELIVRVAVGAAGYADYERQPIRERGQWLLSRVAAIDAVRFAMWADGAGDVYPSQVRAADHGPGRVQAIVTLPHLRREYAVAYASCAEAAVGMAEPCPPGTPARSGKIGIGIVEVTEDLTSTAGPATSQAIVQAAADAVARAEGRKPSPEPGRCTVEAMSEDAVTIRGENRSYLVGYRGLRNIAGLPPRRYVVAWTKGT